MIRVTLLLSLLFNLLHANWFTNLFDPTPTSPLSLPIDLSKAGTSVESEVRIDEDGGYYVTLEFVYTDKTTDGVRDYAIARKISGFNYYSVATGKKYRSPSYETIYKELKKDGIIINRSYTADGVIIPLKVTVYKLNEENRKKLLISQIYNSKGVFSEAQHIIDRDIVKIDLHQGKYSIKIENLTAIKEMNNRKANIRFGRHGNGK